MLLAAACGDGDGTPDEGGPDARAYTAAGRVLTEEGAPIEGAEVVADNQVVYDSNVIGRSDADGRYRLDLPSIAVTWHMSATHVVRYHGRAYSIPLHPSDDAPFAGNAGGVRDFTWRLTGERPDGGLYGSDVIGYNEPGDFSFDIEDVELTLVPDGAIIDGSAGATIIDTLASSPEGFAVRDVPIGRYTISARLVSTDEPLLVRLSDEGVYVDALSADFDAPFGSLPIYRISIEIKRP
jgi:hypothetical protein